MQEIPVFATSAAFAMRVGQLATTIYQQMDGVLASEGVKLPGDREVTTIRDFLEFAGVLI